VLNVEWYVLKYDAYSETLEKQQQKESEVQRLHADMALLKEEMRFMQQTLDSIAMVAKS
jgi:ribosome assembly protein YihI (activator of Der GTPase)